MFDPEAKLVIFLSQRSEYDLYLIEVDELRSENTELRDENVSLKKNIELLESSAAAERKMQEVAQSWKLRTCEATFAKKLEKAELDLRSAEEKLLAYQKWSEETLEAAHTSYAALEAEKQSLQIIADEHASILTSIENELETVEALNGVAGTSADRVRLLKIPQLFSRILFRRFGFGSFLAHLIERIFEFLVSCSQ